MKEFGTYIIIFGIFLVIIGGLLVFSNKIPLLGKLPGDILIKKKNFSFYFPITTCIILSIILSIIIRIFFKK